MKHNQLYMQPLMHTYLHAAVPNMYPILRAIDTNSFGHRSCWHTSNPFALRLAISFYFKTNSFFLKKEPFH